MTFSAIYAVIVGILIFGQWAFFLITGQVSELKTEPVRIRFHIADEFLTATALTSAGWVCWRSSHGPQPSIRWQRVCCYTPSSSVRAILPKSACGPSWVCLPCCWC